MNAGKVTENLDGGMSELGEAGGTSSGWMGSANLLSRIRQIFTRASFIITHYAYFIGLVFLSSVVFWASSKPSQAVSYVDSLFLVVSAISGTGLNTVDLSSVTTWQQTILLLLIMVGGTVWVSMWVNALRRHRFARSVGRPPAPTPHQQQREVQVERSCALNLAPLFDKSSNLFSGCVPGSTLGAGDGAHAVVGGGTGGGRSTTADPAAGLEYRAFTAMGLFVRLYLVLWQGLGCLALGAWIANRDPEVARANGMNPWWVGVFNGVSAFNNSGLSLLDANMTVFQRTPFVVVTMGLMILAGNTMYPILMRFVIWSAWRLLGAASTHIGGLEGERDTWWLVGTVVVINAVGWTRFELLSINNPAIESIPVGYRVLDGLFQSISTRSGGFSVVSMSDVYPSVRLLYTFMMYIPTVPLAVAPSRRPLSVPKEEDALEDARPDEDDRAVPGAPRSDSSTAQKDLSMGHRASDAELGSPVSDQTFAALAEPCHPEGGESRTGFAWRQMQHQLAHDIWLLSLAVFLISAIENGKYVADPVSYSVFNVVFEVVSAYGCVGVSAGLPGATYSFAGGWHGASKVVLCFVMIIGRHRGLPFVMEEYDEQ
ncbi:Low-affinity potassium transport protein [Escovopsis weberi]|uniref:Low-affinity potassium transport protein n=1 Tax=Escovopsis weberi TaxID=150374 RepID=A0A0M8N0A1_ESCWE|nr:Low-affinity potassium transport protein [Escovopsis weberi]